VRRIIGFYPSPDDVNVRSNRRTPRHRPLGPTRHYRTYRFVSAAS